MASAVSAADQAADLLQAISLDPKGNGSEAAVAAVEKLSGAPKVAASKDASAAVPSSRPMTADAAMYYVSGGYPTVPYYYGAFGGVGIWGDYSTYHSRDYSEGSYGDLYHPYGYSYAPYTSTSPVPNYSHNRKNYGSQRHQYSPSYNHQQATKNSFYTPKHSPSSVLAASSPNGADQPSIPDVSKEFSANGVNITEDSLPIKHYQPSVPLSVPYSHQNVGLGYDGLSSKDKPQSKSQNLWSPQLTGHSKPTSTMGSQGSAFNSGAFSNSELYSNYGSMLGPSYWFGPHLYGSGFNGSWGSIWGSRYGPYRGRSTGSYLYSNENLDGLDELKRGPRNGLPKQETTPGPNSDVTSKTHDDPINGDKISATDANKARCNLPDFPESYLDAKFFIIKSYSEDDVHKSVKYGVWASTPNGNKKLDAAYRDAKEKNSCPLFLFFSVNTSGQFIGLAEMTGHVDFDRRLEYWQQDKWQGCFPVKWHIVKDIPNNLLRSIILENNENKPVTNSRDTQEVNLEQGLQMVKIFKDHVCKTSLFDDFRFYDTREKVMQEKRAKQQQLLTKVIYERPLNGANITSGEAKSPATIEVGDNRLTSGVGLLQ